MGLLDKIRKAGDIRRVAYEVKDWGVTVWFVTPSAHDHFSFQQHMNGLRESGGTVEVADFVLSYLRMVVCDENGERLFASDDDFEVLKSKSGPVISELWLAAQDALKDPMLGGDDGVEDFPETPA